ncbi:MAG: ROK family protein [Planctomycetaceae bacterium]
MRGDRSHVGSALLRRINERRLIEALQRHGPASRAALTRVSGLTAPTVSKAVDALLRHGLVEELEPPTPAIGRPGRLVRMAAESATVLGAVIDVDVCAVAAAGLDGAVADDRMRRFTTPADYAMLLDALADHCRAVIAAVGGVVRGVGVSVPGLVNGRLCEVVCSPNLHAIDGRNPARDLEARLHAPCVLLQEADALVLGERQATAARGLDDFAVLDATRGLGLGAMSGGQLLAGHGGMAGEIGHITVDPSGARCGCGNQGCLETLATDTALARLIGERVGRPVTIDEASALLAAGTTDFRGEVRTVTEYLAIAIAAVVNIFNPAALFVHNRLLAADSERFARVLDRVRQRALTAALAECSIVAARSGKLEGAVAGIIHHLTTAWGPTVR